ncbi:MAG: hypothetical protein ACFFF9_05685 [Candidatus Thorarchaeota archaeon]
MAEKKQELVKFVNEENVSAIVLLADMLDLTNDEVRTLITESIADGSLKGSITEDGQRFFKNDISVSEAPVIHSDESLPAFMEFDTRPGRITSFIGLIIITIGVIFFSGMGQQDIGAIVLFVGVFLLFSGLFCLARRKTPS